MSSNSRTCISEKSKKDTPVNDSQDKKVYEMDELINKLIKTKEVKFNTKKSFFDVALSLFEKEGMNGFKVEDNKCKLVSNINNHRKILTFSSTVISENNYEVVFHELAHALCRFRGGYNYTDAHGEIFVYFLFELIKKYFNIGQKELESLADMSNVKYFYNTVLTNKSIDKKEYDKLIKKYDFLEESYSSIGDNKFKNNTGFDLERRIFVSLFYNDNSYWLFERKMFKFEDTILIDEFKDMTKKELSNIFIISPIYNADVSGYKIKSGKFHSFSFVDITAALLGQNYTIKTENKSKTAKARKNKIKEMKEKGYKILSFNDFNQFFAVLEFYVNSLK